MQRVVFENREELTIKPNQIISSDILIAYDKKDEKNKRIIWWNGSRWMCIGQGISLPMPITHVAGEGLERIISGWNEGWNIFKI